MSKEARV